MPKVVPEYKEEAKRRIVEHAMQLFSKKGYYQTRMIDIARSIGVSKGAIYQYFRSKHEVLMAVIELHAKHREREVQSFLTSGIHSLATAEFFDRMLELRMNTPPLGPDLIREISQNKSLMEWLVVSSEKWLQGLIDIIRSLQSDGTLRKDIDAETLARGILALRDGLYGSLSVGTDVEKVRNTWVGVMRIFLSETLES